MKKIKLLKIAGFWVIMCALVFGVWNTYTNTEAHNIQQGIADKIIRFHVIANSDTDEDQQLKLKVKEAVIDKMKVLLQDTDNINETRTLIQNNLEEIRQFAQSIVEQEGYEYPVQAELADNYFPVKTYGDLTFPSGEYEALRITIGHADGKNWWCVMYPHLCFVDSLHAVVPDESKQELRHILTEAEYKEILYGGEENIKIKSKFVDWIKSWKK